MKKPQNLKIHIQSTLDISNSKDTGKKVRDIESSR